MQHGPVTASQSHRQVPVSIPDTSPKPLDSLPSRAREATALQAVSLNGQAALTWIWLSQTSCSADSLALHEGLARGGTGLLSPTGLQPYSNSTGSFEQCRIC